MQSVGEVMAIGRPFPESLQKALRSLETGRGGRNADPAERILDPIDTDDLVLRSATPDPERVFLLEAALRRGVTVERLAEVTGIDPWFLDQIADVAAARFELARTPLDAMPRRRCRPAHLRGFASPP